MKFWKEALRESVLLASAGSSAECFSWQFLTSKGLEWLKHELRSMSFRLFSSQSCCQPGVKRRDNISDIKPPPFLQIPHVLFHCVYADAFQVSLELSPSFSILLYSSDAFLVHISGLLQCAILDLAGSANCFRMRFTRIVICVFLSFVQSYLRVLESFLRMLESDSCLASNVIGGAGFPR